MSKSENISLLGPALFVGLTAYTLVMQGQMPPDSNPSRNMDMRAAREVVDLDPGSYEVAQAHQAIVGRPLTQVNYAENPNLDEIALNDVQPDRQVPPAVVRVDLDAQRLGVRFARIAGAETAPISIVAADPVSRPALAARPDRPRRAALSADAPPVNQEPPIWGTTPNLPRSARRVLRPAAVERVMLARPEPTPIVSAPDYLITVGDNVHLRSGPGTWTAILTRVTEGQRAILLESQGNWRRVTFPSLPAPNFGWMYERYLVPSADAGSTLE